MSEEEADMPEVASRLMREEEASCIASYDGIKEEACFNVNGVVYGPVKISISDFHTIGIAFEQAKKWGGLRAAREIKESIDQTLEMALRYF